VKVFQSEAGNNTLSTNNGNQPGTRRIVTVDLLTSWLSINTRPTSQIVLRLGDIEQDVLIDLTLSRYLRSSVQPLDLKRVQHQRQPLFFCLVAPSPQAKF
jgi:hypothetical protein